MNRKNLLSLHETMVVALISFPGRQASFDEIAEFIEKRNLFPIREGNITLVEQIELRTMLSKGRYHHLFENLGNGIIRFKNLD
ncbi:hypothetical protein GQR60_14600 [Labilibaculum sp. A4]|uniref:hypothetical protein n=1 Tax=Labilibaculum euxinus TaxID=2686357 RepID=UPI000F6228F1|nr:hypothetical protein [Labilibaculum euxinus]MDQ1770219.1 hypothetical protein [Labilibaculum euxinus]MWN77567.1 hypothetical protein [Labilibaculum euxinus]